MTKPVRTTAQADLHILEIDSWWRSNRWKAPALFEQELAAALEMIAALPAAGRRYPCPGANVRRMLLRSTRTHVYYVERDEHVLVVAVWGAIKGVGPDLARLIPP